MNNTRQILRKRAQRLSRRSIVKVSSEKEIEVLDFGLCGENYCIETSYVVEVHRDYNIVRIPTAPPFILGIFNRRGKITPVVDIKVLLNLNPEIKTDNPLLVVVADGQREFGFVVDSILGVRNIKELSISAEMPTLSTIPKTYIVGMIANNTILLNTKNIINDQKIVVNEKVV